MIERLLQSLRALAASPTLQLERYPDFVARADELALDFADALLLATDCPQVELDARQLRALQEVDQLLDEMSGAEKADLWTAAALRTSSEWANVRGAAARALNELGVQHERM